jgi:1-acyl-sn-glycerol-3-phosphate acyltransferase
LRSVVGSIKAMAYFGYYAMDLVARRPKTRRERAEWLHHFCAAMMRAFQVELSVEGEFPRSGVLISNHTGYLDILAYAAMSPVVYCAKGEMEGWPLLGWMATMSGTVFVDRGAGGSAERAKAGMKAAEDEGVPVVFFPEGTTSNGQQVLPFRSGLLAVSLEAEQPITAAYIRYTLDEDNGPGVSVQDDVSFWGEDAPMLKHIFKFVGLRGAHAWVKIAPAPIQFSSDDLDRKVAAVEARDAVLKLAGMAANSVSNVPQAEPVLHQK